MGTTIETCNGCGNMFEHKEEAYLFNDMGIVLCPDCKDEVIRRIKVNDYNHTKGR